MSKKVRNKIILLTLLVLVVVAIILTFIINKEVMENLNNSTKQANVIDDITYMIYDNQDETKMKILITITRDNGIEYIEQPNSTKVTVNGQDTISFDYEVAKDNNYTFKIKENGEVEKEETITVDNNFVFNNSIIKMNKISGDLYYKAFEINKDVLTAKGYDKLSYQIGTNGNLVNYTEKFSVIDYSVVSEQLENNDATVTVYAKAINSKNSNEVTISENYQIDTTNANNAYTANSLLEAIENYNYGSGTAQVTVTGTNNTETTTEVYDLRVYEFKESKEIAANSEFGIEEDTATASDYAQKMAVLKVDGDLTIDTATTLTTVASSGGYGGTKGLLIYCTGTLTNNGTISMTARGAKAEGQDIYLWKNGDGTYEVISDTNRKTGNGGNGGHWLSYSGGLGRIGTSYSGGTGGGAGAYGTRRRWGTKWRKRWKCKSSDRWRIWRCTRWRRCRKPWRHNCSR